VTNGIEGFAKVKGDHNDQLVCGQYWVTVCRIEINAAVVEPVERKANWSLKFRVGGGALAKVG